MKKVLTAHGKPYSYDYLQQLENDLHNLAYDLSQVAVDQRDVAILRGASAAVKRIRIVNGED